MYVPTYAKLFTYLCVAAILCFVFTIFHTSRNSNETSEQIVKELFMINELSRRSGTPQTLFYEDIKYILQWTPGGNSPFDFLGQGRSAFVNNKCEYNNCFVTDDRNYFLDMQDFDVLVFNGKEIFRKSIDELPTQRSSSQKYIFAAMESAHYYPDCASHFDGFFNWTWSYRLDSNVRWGYVTAYDLQGVMVAPSLTPRWPKYMDPPGEQLRNKLTSKSKAAAWFVTNCRSKSQREKFASDLKNELEHYGLVLDIYGPCGSLKCPRSNSEACNKILERDYYFYLSFENSFAEDYVTEKLLNAMDNFAVPIVFGGANYSRFLPPGSYLNARELGVTKLAMTIRDVIADPTKEAYHDFFRWRNHFTYKLTSDNVDVCNLCALLNDEEKYNAYSVYDNFKEWWNPDIKNLC